MWQFATLADVHLTGKPKDNIKWINDSPYKDTDWTEVLFQDPGWFRSVPRYEDTLKTNFLSLIPDIKEGILNYQLKSVEHFVLEISVQAQPGARNQEATKLGPGFRQSIQFRNYSNTVNRLCRPFFRNGRPTGEVSVRENRRWVPLMKSLTINFPSQDTLVSKDDMHRFWTSNGKSFNWTSLPTEIKEHVTQFCIYYPTTHPDAFHGVPAAPKLHPLSPRPPRCEVIQRLGPWRSLVLVSNQVRAITLRLCLNGSIFYRKGFCITSSWYPSFINRLKQLDMYHQLTEPDCIASAEKGTFTLERNYREHPKIYRELNRYATFKHGIRKVYLQFDFLSYLFFFKVKTGGIDRWRAARYVTCDIFEQLPQLNEIIIALPDYDHHRMKQDILMGGPCLFHDQQPCPRILLRLIYESIAKELAIYTDVTVRNFLDNAEEDRFHNLRDAARLNLKFTSDKLEELYADVVGGIKLDHEFDPAECSSKLPSVVGHYEELTAGFFPPRCKCNYPCERIFRGLDPIA